MSLEKFTKPQTANQKLLSEPEELKKEVYSATVARKEKEYLVQMKDKLLEKKDKLIEEEVRKRLRIGESLKASHLTIDIKKEDLAKDQRHAYRLNKQGNTLTKARKEKEDE